jgi:putative ABC transport system ATP-binding protein
MNLKPDELSGGEKQRVAIARALMREPGIILADEPTASLDSKAGDVIVRILHDIAEVQGRTVVIVSHDERLRAYARNIVGLRDGKVIQN